MAAQPSTDLSVPNGNKISKKVAVAAALLVVDALLVSLIIKFVPYTKIDWDAYMSQVSGFLGGERDYENLKGDTGPLVYPAGFLYVYSAIQFITGGEVYPAQVIFGILYIINLVVVFFIYVKTNVLPWWALCLLCLSKRVHSIFMLRLFNDCFAMTLLHTSVACLISRKWFLALIVFRFRFLAFFVLSKRGIPPTFVRGGPIGAVSIKMNVLLYAPPLLLLMLKGMSIGGVVLVLASAALLQILLGLPFLLSHPVRYISKAFNLGRVFIHFWSVNFKFVPEDIFISKEFAISLLLVHLLLLTAFAHQKWCKHEGGIISFLHSRILSSNPQEVVSRSIAPRQFSIFDDKILSGEHVATLMFVGNFIGIVCARSLHYQFYSWYFYSLPFLLWKTPFPTPIRLMLFAGVEFCWNIYPSNLYSSSLLFCIHLFILWGLWIATSEYPYVESKESLQTKED